MQQQILRCSYEVCKLTVPSGQSPDVIQKMFEFQLPDGARIHSVTQIKEAAIIGASNTFLMLVKKAMTFTVDTNEPQHLQ